MCKVIIYTSRVIVSFKHKRLKELFQSGNSRRVSSDLHTKILRRLDFLNKAKIPEEMNIPGFKFHSLRGKAIRYAVSVSGNWRVTFGWEDGAVDVHLEDYH